MKISLTKIKSYKRARQWLFLCCMALLSVQELSASRAVSVKSGAWDDSSVWQFTGGVNSAVTADTVYINSGHTITFLGIYSSAVIKFLRVFTSGVISPMGNNSELILVDSNAIIQLDSGAFITNNSGNNSNHSIQIGNKGIWGRKTCNNNTMTGLSQFTRATPCGGWAALPVKLLGFSASVKAGDLHLDWQTAEENNNDYFTLLLSEDGKHFQAVQHIPARNQTGPHGVRGYAAILPAYLLQVYGSSVFVRLQQTDADGKTEVLSTVLTHLKPHENTVVYSESDAALHISPVSGNETVLLYASSGLRLIEEPLGNAYTHTLSLAGLPAGMYVLCFSRDGLVTESLKLNIR